MVTNEICPYKSDTHHSDESFNSFDFPHVRILNVEAGRFNCLKELLIETDTVGQVLCADFLLRPWIDNPEVPADIVPDSFTVDPLYSLLVDKLPVCHKAVDAITAEEINKLMYKGLTFLPIVIAPLGQKFEK